MPGFGGHNRLTRIHLDAFNVLIREQPTTIGLLRFINPDPTTWPCGEMASRLTTTQCDQEIAGSTPVSVIPFFIFSYLHSRKYSYPELFFLSIPLVIGLMSNWNVQRYSKAYVCIGSVIITVDLFNLTSQYVRFAMASSIWQGMYSNFYFLYITWRSLSKSSYYNARSRSDMKDAESNPSYWQ